ncbi:MAG: DUF2218 domain-containing protein [Erythrobacter sp.]|nr:DUF2218 domain-containing protein [Erythrobacter sp.]
MIHSSTAVAPTSHARRYAAQLGKHWTHNLAVEELGDTRRISFPRDARGADWPGDGVVTLEPDDEALTCRIAASAPGQLEALKDAVERHVDRFAFREGPLAYDWHDEA